MEDEGDVGDAVARTIGSAKRLGDRLRHKDKRWLNDRWAELIVCNGLVKVWYRKVLHF